MKNSLETAVEQYFLDLYRTHPALKGKTLVHFDEDRKAEVNCIVVEAVQGNHRLAESDATSGGVPPVLLNGTTKVDAYEVEVTATFRTEAGATKEQNSLVNDAMVEAVIQAQRGQTSAEKAFGYFLITDDMSGTHENTQNLRRIGKKFNVIARLKVSPNNPVSR